MKYLDGSYTVEATAIFGFILGVLLALMLLGINVYETTVSDIEEQKISDENPTDIFRKLEFGKKVVKEVME